MLFPFLFCLCCIYPFSGWEYVFGSTFNPNKVCSSNMYFLLWAYDDLLFFFFPSSIFGSAYDVHKIYSHIYLSRCTFPYLRRIFDTFNPRSSYLDVQLLFARLSSCHWKSSMVLLPWATCCNREWRRNLRECTVSTSAVTSSTCFDSLTVFKF